MQGARFVYLFETLLLISMNVHGRFAASTRWENRSFAFSKMQWFVYLLSERKIVLVIIKVEYVLTTR